MRARGIYPARPRLTPEGRSTLVRWTRRGSTAPALALRARAGREEALAAGRHVGW